MTNVSLIDLLLSGLKLLAILSTGIWGAVGLLVDYKRDGVITPWGRRALLGTILSTLIAVGSQSVETYKAKNEEHHKQMELLAQQERNATVLREIRRGVYPLGPIAFAMRVLLEKVPQDASLWLDRMSVYVKKNEKDAERYIVPQLRPAVPIFPGIAGSDAFVLLENRAAWPRGNKERIAHNMLRPEFIIRLFKPAEKAKCYWKSPANSKTNGCLPDAAAKPVAAGEYSVAVGLRTAAVMLGARDLRVSIEDAQRG